MIGGKTRVTGLFGHPVGHTLSPAMHNAAFASLGLDWVYLPFNVPPGRLRDAVRGVRALDLAGVNLTVPHKEAVLPLLDDLAPEARSIGAVNTVVNAGGVLTGHNTDAAGFLAALRIDGAFDPRDRSVLILGAGGAARSVAVGLAMAGAREVLVANRTVERAMALAAHIEGLGVRARALPWTGPGSLAEIAGTCALVVQATSMGMHPRPGEGVPFPFGSLRAGTLVADLVYNPAETLFLRSAREHGARVLGGGAMLLHQGALAFELWTACPAPLAVMRAALARGMARL